MTAETDIKLKMGEPEKEKEKKYEDDEKNLGPFNGFSDGIWNGNDDMGSARRCARYCQ